MDYQEYKQEFLESLRHDSAINGTDTEDEFLNRTLSMLVDYEEVDDPVRFGMGDKRGRGNRLMRADGYCFDETDHSLILFISDFQDSFETANLTRSRVDELYWRLYYFLDEVCNGQMEDYFDASDDILKVTRLFRRRMTCNVDDPQLILKIKFYVLTNKELDTGDNSTEEKRRCKENPHNQENKEGRLQWKTSGNQPLVSGAFLRNGNDEQQRACGH